MNDFSVEPISIEHKNQILKIESLIFSSPILKDTFEKYLKSGYFFGFSALCNNEILGYICFNSIGDYAEILDLAVLLEFRKNHVGSMLLEKVLEFCKNNQVSTIALEVRSKNIPAINLYYKFKFTTVSTIKNYYKDPTDDALSMVFNFIERSI